MNVKGHKWLVWVMIISLVSGMWSGSVARGEDKNSLEKTEQVKEITQVEIGMEGLVEGKLVENSPLPSQVTVQEVQVESSTIETISVESATVETISWGSKKSQDQGFKNISEWRTHKVEDNTEYKVEITLKAAEGCKFKEGVNVYMGEKPYDKLENSDEGKVTVSWNFTVGKVPAPTPTPPTETTSPATPTPTAAPTSPPETTPPATPTPSPSVTPTQPPVATEKPAQSASPTKEPSPDTPPIETALPFVSPSPSLAPPVTYTVTLEANGGTVTQKSISFTAEEVSKIKLPKPARKKYVFIGWYEGKKRVEKLTELRNITLKAQWVTASVDMGYLGTLKWEKFKLSPDVKLTEVSIEKKYKKFVKIDKKKKRIKGKKYFKKAKLTLKIDGKNVSGVVLKMKLPEAKIKIKKAGKRRRYVIGVYRTYELAYAYKPGAIGAVAEYSYKKKGKYKKCVKALNRLKGGSVSVKKGRTVYMRVKIYYGKNDYSKSKPKPLKG